MNGKPTNIKLSISNQEPEPVSLQFVGGSLWTTKFDPAAGSQNIRNLTTKQYALEIPAGESETVPYTFQTNMHPQELRLNIAAVISKGTQLFTQQAFNGTVQIVEPSSGFFDPQMYVAATLSASCC